MNIIKVQEKSEIHLFLYLNIEGGDMNLKMIKYIKKYGHNHFPSISSIYPVNMIGTGFVLIYIFM